jgi:hypothetical protein
MTNFKNVQLIRGATIEPVALFNADIGRYSKLYKL